MGRSYLFECPKCCYKTEVSGGTDSGLDFSVQTAACRDCKVVFDSVVRLRLPENGLRLDFQRMRLRKAEAETPPTFESILKRLPLVERNFKWEQFKIRCPVSLAHRVNPWNEPGKCPRCGTFMEKNVLPFR